MDTYLQTNINRLESLNYKQHSRVWRSPWLYSPAGKRNKTWVNCTWEKIQL